MNKSFLKYITAALFAVMIFSGCGIFKSKNSKREFTYRKSEERTITKRDSSNLKVDQSVIVETEQADTLVYTKGAKITKVKPASLQDLLNGLMAVDSGLVKIKITLDSATSTIKTEVEVRPEPLHLKFNRKREVHVNKTENTNVSTEIKKEAITEAKTRSRETESKPDPLPWVWIIIGVVVALFAAYRLRPK